MVAETIAASAAEIVKHFSIVSIFMFLSFFHSKYFYTLMPSQKLGIKKAPL